LPAGYISDADLIAAATPKRGWLRDYLDYAEPFSEAPSQFNLATGLVCLAAAVGRRAFIPHGDEWLHPNVYVCIAAEQARLRKSSTLSTGRRLLVEAFPREGDVPGVLLPDDFSDEGLTDAVAENPTGCFFWSEFGLVLGTTQKTYSATSRQMLADLFDCPHKRERKLRKGTVTIEQAGPSILTASL